MGNGVGGDGQMLPAFSWQQVADHWTFAPVVTCLAIVAGVAYLWGVWRVGARHPPRPSPLWATWLFRARVAVLARVTPSRSRAHHARPVRRPMRPTPPPNLGAP